jgi:hypothetical protein
MEGANDNNIGQMKDREKEPSNSISDFLAPNGFSA